ncbi:MAG: clostripain-related cysteine peptidase [Elusimicrobia bacterium]|nr:clostripain-related cysteine peptidase [Elusimicrobiota bacterium]
MKPVKLFGVLVAIMFFTANVFALEGSITFDQNGSTSEIVKQIKAINPDAGIIPIPSLDKKSAKKWTVMVFANAKNNLEGYGLSDVNEMEMIGSSYEVNIVVELGRIKGFTAADGDWTGSRRYLIKKDNNKSAITSPVLMEIAKSNMGDWNHLVDFAQWSMEKFPAQNYMLVVWNHGSGWNKDIKFEAIRGISYDDETKNHITTPELRLALEKMGKINILAMDACLMQMAEVAYEVKDYTDYVVASEETEPADGYTYDTFLGPLVNNPNMSAAELTKATVDSYIGHYAGLRRSGTQSSINTAAFNKFVPLMDDWIKTAMNANEQKAIVKAKDSAQKFYYSSNKDIYHFIQLAAQNANDEGFIKKSNDLLKFMDDSLITYNKTSGYKYDNAYGLAVYMPNYSTDSSYNVLKWAVETQWDEFIDWYNW